MEDKIVVYRTFYNPIEASIVKARLEDSGVPCFLTDENIATIQPLYNQAIGGVKLNIFERDVEQVNQILAEEPPVIMEDEAQLDTTDALMTCEKCGSTNVSLGQATKKRFSWWVTLLSFFFGVYPFKANNCYHCYNCGHEFK